MIYMGGKFKIAKDLVRIMEGYREPGMPWIVPFMGGGNVIERASGERRDFDKNPNTVRALTLIRDQPKQLPKNSIELDEAAYNAIKADESHLILVNDKGA